MTQDIATLRQKVGILHDLQAAEVALAAAEREQAEEQRSQAAQAELERWQAIAGAALAKVQQRRAKWEAEMAAAQNQVNQAGQSQLAVAQANAELLSAAAGLTAAAAAAGAGWWPGGGVCGPKEAAAQWIFDHTGTWPSAMLPGPAGVDPAVLAAVNQAAR